MNALPRIKLVLDPRASVGALAISGLHGPSD